jgi:SAM-dependent methyltransferase
MYKKFLRLLVCPECGQNLKLLSSRPIQGNWIETGSLICKGKHQYPVVRGIPRFVTNESYAESFGREWQLWPVVQFESANRKSEMTGYTDKYFSEMTTFHRSEIENKTIVEFGCGPGRFLEILLHKGATVIGLEMSRAVDEAVKSLGRNPHLFLVQGDLLKPVFKDNVFSHGYTIGVLHHTPNPELGLLRLAKAVKKGGKVICSVYSKFGFYNYPSLRIVRTIYHFINSHISKKMAFWWALGFSQFSADILYPPIHALGKIPLIGKYLNYGVVKYFFMVILVKSRNWRLLDGFDAITPQIASTHTPQEVVHWYKKANLEKVTSTRNETSFVGVK